uniref:Uncharacterized protein n=1 Tax=Kalanchoe fedtschenkoi TaxID=63787 RepID=A0A7N1A7D4_KALFE
MKWIPNNFLNENEMNPKIPHHPKRLKRKWIDFPRSMDWSFRRTRFKSMPINRNEK